MIGTSKEKREVGKRRKGHREQRGDAPQRREKTGRGLSGGEEERHLQEKEETEAGNVIVETSLHLRSLGNVRLVKNRPSER